MSVLAVLTLRNEAAFLLDWLAHHKAVAVTDFLVLSNDCADGTDTMLDRLEALGHVRHLRNDGPYHSRGIQFTGLNRASTHPLVAAAEWILPLDIDEFVNIHVGTGTVPDLLDALPHADAITLTWRLFGNAGVVRYEDRPIPAQFTRCAPVVLNWPWRAAMFKTLYRNTGAYGKLGVHRPRAPDPERMENTRWFDGEGRELDAAYRTGRIFSPFGRSNYALAQLNHYPLGAIESFVLKADRGRAVHGDDRLGLDYWVERNWTTQTDTSIARMATETARIKEALLADPELHALHRAAVAWRKERFDTLMLQDAPRALFGRLLMAGPTRPLSPEAAAVLTTFAQRAQNTPKPG